MKTLFPNPNPQLDLSLENWPERGPNGNDGDNLTIESLEGAVQKLLDNCAVLSQMTTTLASQLSVITGRVDKLDFPKRFAEYNLAGPAPSNPSANTTLYFTEFRRQRPYGYGSENPQDPAGPLLLRSNALYMIRFRVVFASNNYGTRTLAISTHNPPGYTDPSPPVNNSYPDSTSPIADGFTTSLAEVPPGQSQYTSPLLLHLNTPYRADALQLNFRSTDIRDYALLTPWGLPLFANVQMIHLMDVPLEVGPFAISN